MTLKVIDFIKKPDEEKVTPNQILAGAVDLLETVIVIGIDTEGYLFMSSSTDSRTEINDLLDQIKFNLYSGAYDEED